MAFKGLRFARAEVRNTTANTAIKVAMVAISVIPLLYGALYLFAFLDPYQQLNTVPVAVVNEDAGAQVNGEFRVVGDDVVERLKSNDDGLGWNFVSAEQAQAGLEDGTYYMTCTIPANFTEAIASAESESPHEAQLVIDYNETKNMLASQIGGSVWKEVRQQVSDSVAQEYWENVFGQIDDGAAQIQDAADGATELHSGLADARAGSKEITDNLDALHDGTTSLASGLGTLNDGASTLSSGTSDLASGAATLAAGAGSLASGASTLKDGSSALNSGAQSLAGGSATLAQGTSALSNAAAQLPDVNTVNAAKAGAAQLDGGIDSVLAGLQQLKGSVQDTSGLAGAVAATKQLSSALGDTSTLDDGVIQLQSGVAQVQEGRRAAAGGVAQVQSALGGAQQQVDGAAGILAGIDTTSLDPQTAAQIAQARALLAADQGGASATITAANAGASQVGDGLASGAAMDVGLQQLDGGLAQLQTTADENLAQASAAAAQIANGLDGAVASIGSAQEANTLIGGLVQVKGGYDSFTSQVLPLVEQAPALADAIQQVDAGAARLNSGAQNLAAGASQLDDGMAEALSGSAQLASGATEVSNGATQLDAGATQLASGAADALDGATELDSGAAQLASGSAELTSGLTDAFDGSQELADGLAEGASGMRVTGASQKAEMFSSPVQLRDEYYTSVKNYGTGFAPYFIALGLWVGALMGSFVFKPLNKRLILSGGNPAMVAYANYIPLALLSVVQVLLLLAVLQFGLQLQIDNVPLYYTFGIFTALVFAAIMQMLMAAFGFPGKFISIILLMLQLTSAAGTFPIEQTPAFFQAVNPYLPMTYVVSGMRQAMTGTDMGIVATSVGVLAAFGVGSFLITAFVAHRKRMVSMEDLHPLLQLG